MTSQENNGRCVVAPALAGMAIGICFIALLAFMFRPLTTLSDRELLSRAQETQEAKTFLDRFPDAGVSVDGQSAQVTFRVIRQTSGDGILQPSSSSSLGTGVRELVLKITFERSGETKALLACGGPMSSIGIGNITSLIENTGCFGGSSSRR